VSAQATRTAAAKWFLSSRTMVSGFLMVKAGLNGVKWEAGHLNKHGRAKIWVGQAHCDGHYLLTCCVFSFPFDSVLHYLPCLCPLFFYSIFFLASSSAHRMNHVHLDFSPLQQF
jgi:hypothetical protein